MNSTSEVPPEFIFLPGDFVSHGFSQTSSESYSSTKYIMLKEIIKRTFQEIRTNFPNSYLIPTIGNNDVKFHYQVPTSKEKNNYYSMFFEEAFEKTPQNRKLRNYPEIKRDFLNGGYYKADLSEDFSVIVLNTLYYSLSNNPNNDLITGDIQLEWLDKQLKGIKERSGKAIVGYHIFPGLNYFNGIQYFLNKTANERLNEIFFRYKDIIVINVGAHVHMNGFRIAHHLEESNTKEKYVNTILSASVSPVYNNNPSFLRVEIEEFEAKKAVYSYFNLKDLLNDIKHEEFDLETIDSYFFQYNFNQEYDLVDLKGESLSEFIIRLYKDEDLLRKFLLMTFGFKDSEENRNFALGSYLKNGGLFENSTTWEFDQIEKRKFLCTLEEISESGFNDCMGTR